MLMQKEVSVDTRDEVHAEELENVASLEGYECSWAKFC
jgi:hypothetical protein